MVVMALEARNSDFKICYRLSCVFSGYHDHVVKVNSSVLRRCSKSGFHIFGTKLRMCYIRWLKNFREIYFSHSKLPKVGSPTTFLHMTLMAETLTA